jgi:Laminin G domain
LVDDWLTGVDLFLPLFSDRSYLKYNGIGRDSLSFTDIEIVLKTSNSDGLVLYNGYTGEPTTDFISIAVIQGFVQFRFNLGTGPVVMR